MLTSLLLVYPRLWAIILGSLHIQVLDLIMSYIGVFRDVMLDKASQQNVGGMMESDTRAAQQ